MPQCSQCGKPNASESLFCEVCGARLATTVSVGAAVPVAAADKGPICSHCHTVNEPGMGFCRMCGNPLGRPSGERPASPASSLSPAETLPLPPATPISFLDCPSCARPTPSGLAFCQNCGTRLGAQQPAPAAAGPAAAATGPSTVEATVRARMTPPPIPVAARATSPGMAVVDPGATVKLEARSEPAVFRTDKRSPSVPPTRITGPVRTVAPSPPARGRLVVVREGRDAEVHAMVGETFDVGRTEGQLVFGGDPHVAARHVRFSLAGGSNGATTVRVRPLDTVNGVFVRVAGECELVPGDVILVGRQLLRYEGVGVEERDPPALAEHGVRLLGSMVREAWGRLRQLTPAGTTRDVWHLGAPEVCIGRRGEVWCDDPDVADRHAVVRRGSGRARLEDQGSAQGTFVRLRGERELRGGEQLRIGEQLVRFEAAGQAGA